MPIARGTRRLGVLCCALLFVQLAIAAVMRHSFAGMAIPTFPASNFDGTFWPHVWNFRIGIHFAHRIMAVVLCLALPLFVFSLLNDRQASHRLRAGAIFVLVLLTTQIFLGAQIIWTYRAAYVTTGHVVVGAMTLVTTFWLTWRAHRDAMEARPRA
jgi:cytochrome c oxidase assembly protein subunit 15